MLVLNRLICLIALFLSVFLSGCMQQYVTPTYVSPDYHIDSLKSSTVKVVISSNVLVEEFTRAFEKRFGTGSQLARELTAEVAGKLKLNFPSINVNEGSNTESKFLISPFSANDSLFKVEKLKYITSLNEAYILLIDHIVVSNKYVYHGGGGPYGGGGGSTEYCVVNYNVKIIRKSDQQEILKLMVKGSDSASFFDYQGALVGAINNAVEHLMGYLQLNTIEFLH